VHRPRGERVQGEKNRRKERQKYSKRARKPLTALKEMWKGEKHEDSHQSGEQNLSKRRTSATGGKKIRFQEQSGSDEKGRKKGVCGA